MTTLLHVTAALRPARLDDTDTAAELLRQTMPWLGEICGLTDDEHVRRLLRRLFAGAHNRVSFRHARIAQAENRPAGLLVAYPAATAQRLMLPTLLAAMRAQGWLKSAGILRGFLKLGRLNECTRGDFYIAHLAVHAEYRGLGIGGQLLRYAEKRAGELNLARLALIVEQNNTPALEVYRHMGFRETGVTSAGPRAFYRMVKPLNSQRP